MFILASDNYREIKYCDKLAENFKSVFVLEHQHGWPILFQLLRNCVARMDYIFSNVLVRPTNGPSLLVKRVQ